MTEAVVPYKDILGVAIDVNKWDWCQQDIKHRQQVASPRKRFGTTQPNRVPIVTFNEAIAGVTQLLSTLHLGWPRKTLILLIFDHKQCKIVHEGTLETFSTITDHNEVGPLARLLQSSIQQMNDTTRVDNTGTRVDNGHVEDGEYEESLLGCALSQLMCILNSRMGATGDATKARMLVVDVSRQDNYSTQYPALMNIAFASKQMGIPIDICSVNAGVPAAAVQQLAEISSGTHLCFQESLAQAGSASHLAALTSAAFASFFVFHFTCSVAAPCDSSPWPLMSAAGGIGFSIVCHCHQKSISLAKICSCCLTGVSQ